MKTSEILSAILKASNWSQEQLAQKLGVSFATLNSWVNERSHPRKMAVARIEQLLLDIVGTEAVDDSLLLEKKQQALKQKMSPHMLVSDARMLDTLTLYLTYHTNTIEGSTMTLSDVEDVIFDNRVLSNRTAIEQTEARNHQATLHWLIDQMNLKGTAFVIDEELMLSIHLRLMHGIIADAGKYRNHTVRIMGSRVVLANYLKVPALMANLVWQLQNNKSDIISKIANTHAVFEQIHPFSDGNGRTGRLIMLVQALQAGVVPPLVVKERKSAYYKYLELAQTKDEFKALEQFIAESVLYTSNLLK
jgi:Fic family protein